VRWKYGIPPVGNANYAWLQHIIHHLAPNGTAGVVLANGSMSSNSSGEGDVRQSLVEHDLVDCMVALPGNLFYGVTIPCCLWFFAKNKNTEGFRNRKGEVLFIDARKLGTMTNRVLRDFSTEDILKISDTYHAWRGQSDAIERRGIYEDVSGFSYSANLENIKTHGYVLTPGRFVGAEDELDDGITFGEKFEALTSQLNQQFLESRNIEQQIRDNLERLGD
jgi:type I restriction enzyme M protein